MLWRLIPLLLLIALNAYFSVLFVAESPQQWVFLLFALVAEFFTLGAIFVFIRFRGMGAPKLEKPAALPSVALVKVCCNEKPEMVIRGLESMKNADYPKGLLSLALLDDSNLALNSRLLRKYCEKNGIAYLHREARVGFKAGALNNYLSGCNAEFIAVFDADEELSDPRFILDNVGFFIDKRLAVVQTNKHLLYNGTLQRAAAAINGIFYNFVNPVSARQGTGAFLGSAALLRRSALQSVGGFPVSLVEDVALSFRLYLAGFGIAHNPKSYISGTGAGNYRAFMSQHGRYIVGITGMLPFYLANIWKIRASHQISFAFQYLGLYFVSFFQLAYFLFLLYMQISGAFSFNAVLAGVIYLLQSILAVCIFSKEVHGSYRLGLAMYLMNISISLERLAALLASAFRKAEFLPTATARSSGIASALASLVFAAPFLYFSYPLSGFSLVGVPIALFTLAHLAFMLLDKSANSRGN